MLTNSVVSNFQESSAAAQVQVLATALTTASHPLLTLWAALTSVSAWAPSLMCVSVPVLLLELARLLVLVKVLLLESALTLA